MFYRVEAHHIGGNVAGRYESLEEAQEKYKTLKEEALFNSRPEEGGEAIVMLSIVLENEVYGGNYKKDQ